MTPLHDNILRALLYFDIWHHPLTAQEVHRFLPVNSLTPEEVKQALEEETRGTDVREHEGYFFLRGKTPAVVAGRTQRAAHARRLWHIARISMHIIRRFPYVRAVCVSGDLSKNSTGKGSDVDFFVITAPGRLWVARTALILFKKTFLLNRKKYFCMNSFVTEDGLRLDEENIFTATEVATLKPLYNSALFLRYLQANDWILRFFPNFDVRTAELPPVCERRSLIQRLAENILERLPIGKLDIALQRKMEEIWERRYPDFDPETRSRIFRCSRTESRAYAGNFQEKILALYSRRLREFGVKE